MAVGGDDWQGEVEVEGKEAGPCSHKRAAASFYKIPSLLIDSAGAPKRKRKRLDFCGNTKRTCGESGWRMRR